MHRQFVRIKAPADPSPGCGACVNMNQFPSSPFNLGRKLAIAPNTLNAVGENLDLREESLSIEEGCLSLRECHGSLVRLKRIRHDHQIDGLRH